MSRPILDDKLVKFMAGFGNSKERLEYYHSLLKSIQQEGGNAIRSIDPEYFLPLLVSNLLTINGQEAIISVLRETIESQNRLIKIYEEQIIIYGEMVKKGDKLS